MKLTDSSRSNEVNPLPQRDRRAELLASLTRSFAEAGNNYPVILETTARLVAQAAGDACIIRLTVDAGRYHNRTVLHHVSSAASLMLPVFADTVVEDLQKELAETVAQSGKPFFLPDFMARQDVLAQLPGEMLTWLQSYPVHAVMILPLRTLNRILGTLTILRSRSLQAYTQDDQYFWQDVADRAALAIENARLYAEEVHRNRQLKALHDATAALLSTLDLEVLLGRILDVVQQAIPAAEHGILFLIVPATGRLEVRATSGFGDPRIRRTGRLQNTRANQAMREQRPLIIYDALEDTNSASGQDSFRSAVIAPLILGEEVLGALFLSASIPNAFDASDLQLLVSFATTTTAALHNAMLHAELQKIAITDALTGLYNRRGLHELGRHEVERVQRFNKPLSAIMLDIDHFKNVNDRYGHSIGDQVLCGLAERCRSLIRQVDIMARYGGEEFAILLPETDLFHAVAIGERLREAVQDSPFGTDQGPLNITISLGISRSSQNITSLTPLLEQADSALYLAKQKGRNRVEPG